MLKKISAFTLIELLIVVAIIAILAAIAVPNFLEAQTRSKISRTMNDMRALGIAYTSYNVEWGKFPVIDGAKGYPLKNTLQYIDWVMIEGFSGRYFVGQILTTPVAFISRAPIDPFMTAMNQKSTFYVGTERKQTNLFSFITSIRRDGAANSQFESWFQEMQTLHGLFPRSLMWSMESCGPDLTWWDGYGNNAAPAMARNPNRFIYDPTNGTTSQGQLVYSSEGWISPARK